MLVLSRKSEQSIQIGSDIVVTVLSVANGRVKLGIRAPGNVRVLRGELEEVDSTPDEHSSNPRRVAAPDFAVQRIACSIVNGSPKREVASCLP
jgi:carbon storage regulator